MKRQFFKIMSAIVTISMLIPFSSTLALASPLDKQPICNIEQITDENFVAAALSRKDVNGLSEFLLGLGYQIIDNLSVVSSAKCGEDQATIAVIPFTQDGSTLAAHITIWKANWNSKSFDGAIAIVENSQDVVYSYSKQKGILSESKENWGKQAKIPFESIQGFKLPMTKDLEVAETMNVPSQLFQENSSIQPLVTTYCKTVQAARVGYTLLGFVAYKFWERVYFCYNGVSAVSNVSVSAYVSNMNSQEYIVV